MLALPVPPVRPPRAPPAAPPVRPACAAASNRLIGWSPSPLVGAAGVLSLAAGGEAAAGVLAARGAPAVLPLACACSRCTFSGMPYQPLATIQCWLFGSHGTCIQDIFDGAVWVKERCSHCTIDLGSWEAHALHIRNSFITLWTESES